MILEKFDAESIKNYMTQLSDYILENTEDDMRIVFILASKKEKSISVISEDEASAIEIMDMALTDMTSHNLRKKVPPELIQAVKEFVDRIKKQ